MKSTLLEESSEGRKVHDFARISFVLKILLFLSPAQVYTRKLSKIWSLSKIYAGEFF